MYQVPATVLNQILETYPLTTAWAEALFKLDQEELNQTLEQQASALEAAGVADRVILAYQKMGPVLAEQEAITEFIKETGNMELRSALPAAETADEAVMMATEEYRLTPAQAKMLLNMLKRLPME